MLNFAVVVVNLIVIYTFGLPDRHGVMDNAVNCHAGGSGSIPAMSKWFFLLGIRW